MNKDRQKQMILEQPPWRVMLALSWPAVLAMVLYGLNTVFDAVFVGRYVGETALAGVSLAYPLSQLSLGLGSLTGVGAGTALSIALGAGDREVQRKLLGSVNSLNLLFGLGLTLLGLIFTAPLVRMMGGSGAELEFGTAYFRTTLYGGIFWIAGLSGNMVVRAEGKMGSAALMMALGLLVNIGANWVLIVGMGMGVEGAAWGTNLGMLVYTLLFLLYAAGPRISFEARPFRLGWDAPLIKAIFANGVPSLIMTVMTLIQGIVVLNALSRYGSTADLAFYGIAYRIFMFMLTPIFGLMRALQPAVGINFGARRYDRVIRSFEVFALGATLLMLPSWLFMMIDPQGILQLILPARSFSAADLGNFRIFMSLLPLLPIIFMAMTFFPAVNKGGKASLMGIARQLVFYVPLMLILPRFFGVSWVYKGAFLIDLVITAWVFFLVRTEFRLLRKGEAVHLN